MKKLGMFVMIMAVLAAAPAFADESTKPAGSGSSSNSKIPCTAVNNDSGAKTADTVQSSDQQDKTGSAAKGK